MAVFVEVMVIKYYKKIQRIAKNVTPFADAKALPLIVVC